MEETKESQSPLLQVWCEGRNRLDEAMKKTIEDLDKDVPKYDPGRGETFYAMMQLNAMRKRIAEDAKRADFSLAIFVPEVFARLQKNHVETARSFCGAEFSSLESLFQQAGKEVPKALRILHKNWNDARSEEMAAA